jgi:hypothetical protein
MDATAMSLELHGCGIHALWSGAGEASVTEVRFRRASRLIAAIERPGL